MVFGLFLLLSGGFVALIGFSSSDPSGPPLRLGVTRFLAAEEVRARFAGLLPYLSERLDRPVELVIAADSRGLIELLDEGEIHIAALSSAAYVRATRERDDLRILATPLARGGSKGYGGAILVRARSEIRSLDDLRGRPFCYVKRDSTSGWLLPRAELREAGLDPDRDLRGVHYGNQHEETLKLLHREECDAAAVFTNIWHEAGKHGMSPDAFRAIANYHMPHDAYVVTKAMSEKEAEAIRAALLSLEPGSDVAERVLRPHDTGGFAAATDADYERIRRAREDERLERADADERIEDEPPAVDDAVVAALVEIEKLRQARRYQAALDRSKALLKSHPRVAVAHLVYGNIYFDRMWWRDGFAAYTEAIALDSGLAGHPTVIANAIRGLSSRSRPWLAERFIRDHIGAAAIEPLEEEARTTKSKSLRQRALRLAGQIRKGG
jgi:phosphonate transport system substrate-binding protein